MSPTKMGVVSSCVANTLAILQILYHCCVADNLSCGDLRKLSQFKMAWDGGHWLLRNEKTTDMMIVGLRVHRCPWRK